MSTRTHGSSSRLSLALCVALLHVALAQRTVTLPWTLMTAGPQRLLSADIVVGDTIVWDWGTASRGEPHSVREVTEDGVEPLFNSTLQQPPGRFEFTFMDEGVYVSQCIIHPSAMRATITVGPATVDAAAGSTTVVIGAVVAVIILLILGGTCFYLRRRGKGGKKTASGGTAAAKGGKGKSKASASKKANHTKRASKEEKLIPSRDNSDEGLHAHAVDPEESVPLNLEEGRIRAAARPSQSQTKSRTRKSSKAAKSSAPEPVVTSSSAGSAATESEQVEGGADVFDITSNLASKSNVSKQLTRGSVSRAKTSHAFGPTKTSMSTSSRDSTLKSRKAMPMPPTVSENAAVEEDSENTVSYSLHTDTSPITAEPTILEDGEEHAETAVSYEEKDGEEPMSSQCAVAKRVMTANEYTLEKRKSGPITVPLPMRPSDADAKKESDAAPTRAMTAAEYTAEKRKSGKFTVPKPMRPSDADAKRPSKKRTSKVFTFTKSETLKQSEDV